MVSRDESRRGKSTDFPPREREPAFPGTIFPPAVETEALPAAWYLARNFAAMRLGELGRAARDATYPAVSAAISSFEKRLKIDRGLQRKLKATRVLLKI
jgi:hypothetical protein